ncbi:MAG: endonuclease MutS2 [Clostridia bacterium]|nr:endonuclease MutS2 [Clostridia bacterium]
MKNNLMLNSDNLNKSADRGAFERAMKTLELDKVLELVKDCASTEKGKEKIAKLFPSTSKDTIIKNLKETSEAKLYVQTKTSPSFMGAKDITKSIKTARKGGMLSMRQLLDISNVLSVSLSMESYLSLKEKAPLLDEYKAALRPNKFLRDKINSAIISEDLMSDNASQKLFDIRRSIKNSSNKIRDVLQKYTSGANSKYLQENIVTIRNGRYVIPVKNEYKNEIKGLVHDTSSSGSTLFIEPMQVVEENNKLRTLEAEEKAETERILYELSAECDRFSHDILSDFEIITSLDMIFAKAEYSYATESSEPVINTDKYINLVNARHPLLDKESAVPINVYLGKKFTTLVITGPNTGGKTVTLKTIGLLSLMAQCGLHIPASDSSTLPVFDSILADIGDEQSIEQSLSTFSAHMVNIVKILREFTPDSLILFDELGAGTDPIEGAALAQSILERVTSCKALCASTTHYAELKAYALETKDVSNASCEFDVETLQPTYRLIIGLPGKSNAFAIASKLGISKDIIKASKAKIDNGTRSFEGLIGKLERERIDLEKKKDALEKNLAHSQEMYDKAEKMRKEFNERIEKESQNAERKAKELLERARSSADYVFSELQEIQKKKDSSDFKEMLEKSRENVRKSLGYAEKDIPEANKIEAEYIPPRDYAVGDTVKVEDFGKTGIIASLDGKNATVTFGSAKIKTEISKLRLVEDGAKEKTSSPRTPKKASEAHSETDVRGMTGDDAIFVVDKFLDDAILSSLPTVRIIHGKGTGALRKALWDYLKHDKRVSSLRSGSFGEGDAGVTVVNLK